jgi:hypothetical protein
MVSQSRHRAEGRYNSMRLIIAGVFAFSGVAFAANVAPVSYHDGTLVSFSMAASGDNCADSSGQACSDVYETQYLVKSEGILYALTPVSSAKNSIAQKASLGWSKAFSQGSSLYHQQPGILLQLRDDGRYLFVKVGNRESKYTAVEAR